MVAAVFSKTNSLTIKLRSLEAFNLLCGGVSGVANRAQDDLNGSSRFNLPGILDKYTMQEKIVPLLKAIKTKEPSVMMAALGVFKQIANVADSDFLALELLPILWSFSLGPLLDLQQFSEYMSLIKAISVKIEQEHTKKLRELALNSTSVSSKSPIEDSVGMHVLDSMLGSSIREDGFERLVLGKGIPTIEQATSVRPSIQPSLTTQPLSPISTWSNQKPSLQPGIINPQSRTITPDQFQSRNTLTPLQGSQNSPNTFSNNMGAKWPTKLPPPPESLFLLSKPSYRPATQTPYEPPSSWQTSRSTTLSTPNTNGWSIPPPPTASNTINPAFAAHPGTRVQLGNGNEPLSVSIGNPQPNGIRTPPPAIGPQKSGLDRYESLL